MNNHADLGLAILLVTSPVWIIVIGKVLGEALYDFFKWLDE